jgi:hypothetical protein
VRILAVDWSGRRTGERRAIWCAEAAPDGLVRLEDGRTRDEVADHLLDLAADDPALVVGLDFSFSLPAWFLHEHGYTDVDALWEAATRDGEEWIRRCAPPFWGRPGARRPELPAHFRRTEAQVAAVGGIRPKSAFQVSGAGSVGAGSIRGFPVLARLRAAGWSIWPFDAGVPPVVLEVWPRMLSGPVVKSRADARARHLDASAPGLPEPLRTRAIGCDDAFDAAVAALGMAQHRSALVDLPVATDPVTRLEGTVWSPPAAQASAVASRAIDASTTTGSNGNTSSSSTK